MPQHGEVNPNDNNMIWDVNHGRWIQKPGTTLPYEQAQKGFMQTAGNQQAYSDYLTSLQRQMSGPSAPTAGAARAQAYSSLQRQMPGPSAPTAGTAQAQAYYDEPRSGGQPAAGAFGIAGLGTPSAPDYLTSLQRQMSGPSAPTAGAARAQAYSSLQRQMPGPSAPTAGTAQAQAYYDEPRSGGQPAAGAFGIAGLGTPSAPAQNPAVAAQVARNRNYGPMQINVSDVDPSLSEWGIDSQTGWVQPTSGAMGGAAFPNVATGLSYGPDYGFNKPESGFSGGTVQVGGGNGGDGTDGSSNFWEPFGLGPDSEWQIPGVNYGEMPTMSGTWEPGFQENYFNNAENVRNRIGEIYNAPLAQINPALWNKGDVPQVSSTPTDSFAALQFLLSGQGFDPATITKMKANAADSLAGQNAARLSTSRMAAQRAGLGDSGISVALQDQAARQNAAGLNQANNQVDIANALQGIDNLTKGASLELNRGQGNASQANMMALQSAQLMFQALQQNTANTQLSNMTNAQNAVNQQMASRNAQSGVMSGAGNQFGQASLQQAQNANQQNAANRYNWQMAQANQNNLNNQFNMNTRVNRYNNAINAISGLSGQQNPAQYTTSGTTATVAQQPNTVIPSAIANVGSAVVNNAEQSRMRY
jgi:hypothetical protein